MKLLIFEPSTGWGYCGGALVIIAEDFVQAKKLWLEDITQERYLEEARTHTLSRPRSLPNRVGLFVSERDVPKTSYGYGKKPGEDSEPLAGLGGHGWVLVHVLGLDPNVDEQPRILFYDYNYS